MIKLNPEFSLSFEAEGNKMRVIVYKGNDEYVCRKSSPKELNTIVTTDDTHLFKGRLQLFRSGDAIGVSVKGKPEGFIPVSEFSRHLSK